MGEFHAESAYLHLPVIPPAEVQLAIAAEPCAVTSGVAAMPGPERVGLEAVTRRGLVIQVPDRKARAGQHQLADHARRRAGGPVDDHPGAQAADRASDRCR